MTPRDRVWQALKGVPYPGYSRDIVSFGLVRAVTANGGPVQVSLAVADLPAETRRALTAAVTAAVREA